MPKKLTTKKQTLPKGIKETFAYNLELSLNDAVFKTKGDSVTECLEQIEKFFAIKTKGVFVIKSGKKRAEVVLRPAEVRRLLNNVVAKTIFDKRINLALK